MKAALIACAVLALIACNVAALRVNTDLPPNAMRFRQAPSGVSPERAQNLQEEASGAVPIPEGAEGASAEGEGVRGEGEGEVSLGEGESTGEGDGEGEGEGVFDHVIPEANVIGEAPHTALSDKQVDEIARIILKEARKDHCDEKDKKCREAKATMMKCAIFKKHGLPCDGSKHHGEGTHPHSHDEFSELLKRANASLDLANKLSSKLGEGEHGEGEHGEHGEGEGEGEGEHGEGEGEHGEGEGEHGEGEGEHGEGEHGEHGEESSEKSEESSEESSKESSSSSSSEKSEKSEESSKSL